MTEMSTSSSGVSRVEIATPHLRTSKACEECRRRKTKCDGGKPCKPCHGRRLQCNYRAQTRTRNKMVTRTEFGSGGNNSTSTPRDALNVGNFGDPEGESPWSSSTIDYREQSPLEEKVAAGVTATQAASPSCTLQLYYGPSSNFSLLQHIHRRLNPLPSEKEGDVKVQTEVDDGLDQYRYRGIFFGRHSFRAENSITHLSGTSSNGDSGNDLMFMSPSLASRFLQDFLATVFHLFPFLEAHVLEEQVRRLYGTRVDSEGTSTEKTILLAALAMGATMTDQFAWAETLFSKAKALAAELDDVVNLESVQISLLLSHYQSILGRPNSSWLLIGAASRKALAAGLHRETLSRKGSAADFERIQERRATFWSLYFAESTLSYGLGRPMSISESDINTPYPEGQPFTVAFSNLGRIVSRSARNLYSARRDTLLNLWKIAKRLKEDLENFWQSLPGDLRFGRGLPCLPGTQGVKQLILSNAYYLTMILNYRTFLVFLASWQRNNTLSVADHKHVPISPKTMEEHAPWVLEGAATCVEAARHLLSWMDEAYRTIAMVKGLMYNGFFVESACLPLIFNMLMDKSSIAIDMEHVKIGIKCLERSSGKVRLDSHQSLSYTLSRMLTSVEQSLQEDKPTSNNPEEQLRPPEAFTPMNDIEQATNTDLLPAAAEDAAMASWRDFLAADSQALDFNVGNMQLDLDTFTMDLDQFMMGMGGYDDVGI